MSEQKPNVFPSMGEQPIKPKIDSDYENKKIEIANQVYDNSYGENGFSAIEEMRKRTEEQIRMRNEQLENNIQQTNNYHTQYTDAMNRKNVYETEVKEEVKPKVLSSPAKSPVNNLNVSNLQMQTKNSYIEQLSQPQFNMSFDLIPLPSEGKLYRSKKNNVKVAYMTTMDENILTSPNLLQSGEFLEILINRKLLETDIRYNDLHVGDRNAIMIWLRATSYGEMYPVTLFDENDEPFETEINLNELTIKKLGAEPDEEGLFSFELPISKYIVKFKLLTVGDIENIEKLLEEDKKNEIPVNNSNTYMLEKLIVDINGERNKVVLRDAIQTLRVKDVKDLKTYIDSIESGVDLNIEVGTPGGGSVKTFLPLNFKFFWPDIQL
jgi:hypothetical protein